MHKTLTRSLLFAAFAAALATLPAVAAETTAEALPEAPAAATAPDGEALGSGCDAPATGTPLAGGLGLGDVVFVDHDVPAGNCWQEYKTEYSCTCPNNRVREKHYSRICCPWSGCGGWSYDGYSCTYLCGP